jgi:Ca2+/Na+ antiporter
MIIFGIIFLLGIQSLIVALFENNKKIKIILFSLSGIFFVSSIIILILSNVDDFKPTLNNNFNILMCILFLILYTLLIFAYVLLKGKRNEITLDYYDKGIKNNKNSIFLIVNHLGNVVNISNSFGDEFFSNESVKKKNFINLVNTRLQIDSINGNPDLKINEFLDSFINSIDQETSIEIGYSNYKGDKSIVKASINKIEKQNKYFGYVWVGEKQSDYHIMHIEKEYQKISSQNNRRIGLIKGFLDLYGDMAFTRELDKNELLLGDKLVELFHFNQKIVAYDDFFSYIHLDDSKKHSKIISELTKDDNTYESFYRYFVNNTYIYLKETGILINNDISRLVLGRIEIVPTKHFNKTELVYLDELLNQSDLETKLGNLIHDSKYFQVMAFSIKNIVDINARTRDIGNLCIEHVVKTIHTLYSSKDIPVYRIYGCVFIILITDTIRFSQIEKLKESNSHGLNTIYQFSSIDIECNVCAGISSYASSKTITSLINDSIHALKIAISSDYNNDICFFKDVK